MHIQRTCYSLLSRACSVVLASFQHALAKSWKCRGSWTTAKVRQRRLGHLSHAAHTIAASLTLPKSTDISRPAWRSLSCVPELHLTLISPLVGTQGSIGLLLSCCSNILHLQAMQPWALVMLCALLQQANGQVLVARASPGVGAETQQWRPERMGSSWGGKGAGSLSHISRRMLQTAASSTVPYRIIGGVEALRNRWDAVLLTRCVNGRYMMTRRALSCMLHHACIVAAVVLHWHVIVHRPCQHSRG